MNPYLLNFDRHEDDIYPTDASESIAKFGLGLLQIGLGKTVLVKSINEKISFEEQSYSLFARIAAIVAGIVFLPLTLPLSIIGAFSLFCSDSHHQLNMRYQDSLKIIIPGPSPLEVNMFSGFLMNVLMKEY